MDNKKTSIVGLGEALFDVFPDRQILGGAPMNVAVHAHQMLRVIGGQGIVASRIGDDELGCELGRELAERGMSTQSIQIDTDRPTGQVFVTFEEGNHVFDIAKDSAWDGLQYDTGFSGLARRCSAVCFGTLAQRSPQSRLAIHQFLRDAESAIRLFDVNLRQHYFDRDVILQSCRAASAVKLNDEELPVIAKLLALNDATSCDSSDVMDECLVTLCERFALDFVALTRGERGTVLLNSSGRFEAVPAGYPMMNKADTVGAGDACAAGLLVGGLLDWPPERILQLANRAGAYVASVPGATPKLPEEIFQMIAGE
ncbi:MAG: PfkB family carbohydrate kinase [Pirellulales bacterium]